MDSERLEHLRQLHAAVYNRIRPTFAQAELDAGLPKDVPDQTLFVVDLCGTPLLLLQYRPTKDVDADHRRRRHSWHGRDAS